MAQISNHRRPVLAFAVCGALGWVAATAGPAAAANTIDVSGVGPANVQVDYTCEAAAGVASIQAMAGDPNAESPSATGTQSDVSCDGTAHTTVVVLTPASAASTPLAAGQTVQVRVALVDSGENVVSGQAKVVTLG
ncbi:hypothetical protein [Nocardia inohanensis]|uniref:hypothetical protein n=1 Tax=Nocardia inohanensis TaxID=209246 RepID=UPI0008359F80|nr:hypothetical protein [Nocardia inohanensis]